MPLVTTADLIKILQQADPDGSRPVRFRVRDDERGGVVAVGEVEGIEATLEAGMQTDAGDIDVLQLDFELFCP